jgi:two-component system, NtrC family, nitrogen regulation sensor histidine kinase NtrY
VYTRPVVPLRVPGKIERRLATAILLTAVVPLVVALLLVNALFKQASAIWFDPQVGLQLDRGVDVYQDYVKAIKDDMRHQTDAIAADELLREAARTRNSELVEAQLLVLFPRYPELVTLTVEGSGAETLGRRDRGRPVDESTERSLPVSRALMDDPNGASCASPPPRPPCVTATFAINRKRLDELETTGDVVTKYHALEQSRGELYRGYVYAFSALLGATMLLTLVLGYILARGVTKRISLLGTAINLVAGGNTSVRVPVTGNDELSDLARAFNDMISEMAESRARIEFLQRIGAWQEMAQRLAHEIKNPLTPIQLAVQECHRKYGGDDPRFRALLDTTLEIVQEEVGTLRRLVGDFSNFARLPQAELDDATLREFLRDCSDQLAHLDGASERPPGRGPREDEAAGDESLSHQNVDVRLEVPDEELPAAIDRQMLRRVLINLVRNAVQAIRDARAGRGAGEVLGRVVVSARREGEGAAILVDDDGPGVPVDARARIFDPYFTTKKDGTGLGLAIVKKIVVEHGGRIEVERSESLGGARFVVHLPGPRSVAIAASKEARERAAQSGVKLDGAPPA